MTQTISLVLGSGGARGIAHIGVIRELEEAGYEIRAIAGCSMGALIGGCYAAGELDAFEEWVCELTEWDVLRFLDLSFKGKAGMLKGDLIIEKLRELVGDTTIQDLPIDFTAVATEIVSHKEVWMARGDLFEAIRASIAIPGVFTPVEIGKRTLVDGGLLNPVPVAPTMDDGTDLTIAVSLQGEPVKQPLGPEPPAQRDSLANYRSRIESFMDAVQKRLGLENNEDKEPRPIRMVDVLMGTFDVMQSTIARYRLASYPPDVLIELPENICEVHEFYRANQLIHAGRHWARKVLEKLPDSD